MQNRRFFLDYTDKSTVISRRTGTSPHNLGLKEDNSESRTLGNVLLNLIDCLEENQVRILLFKLLNHLLPQSQSYLSWQHKALLSQESLEPSTGVLDSVLCNLWTKRTVIQSKSKQKSLRRRPATFGFLFPLKACLSISIFILYWKKTKNTFDFHQGSDWTLLQSTVPVCHACLRLGGLPQWNSMDT